VRTELAGAVPPDAVEAAVVVLEREKQRLAALLPQVSAVDAALRGVRHRARL
jgi:hypothetical protein